MAIRIALFVVPAVVVAGLVLMLNGLDASVGIVVPSFGLIAVAAGGALGYFADRPSRASPGSSPASSGGNSPRRLSMASVVVQGGPVGQSVADSIEQSLADAEFRAEYERLRPYEELARIVIMRRAALGLTQAELADRMGTTASTISRIESGQHATGAQTLKKIADAFDGRG